MQVLSILIEVNQASESRSGVVGSQSEFVIFGSHLNQGHVERGKRLVAPRAA